MAVCFCTLAIHAPYRSRARMLCADTASVPWVILTDEPADFADLSTKAGVRRVFTDPHYERALAALRRLGAGRERLDWLAGRLPLQ